MVGEIAQNALDRLSKSISLAQAYIERKCVLSSL